MARSQQHPLQNLTDSVAHHAAEALNGKNPHLTDLLKKTTDMAKDYAVERINSKLQDKFGQNLDNIILVSQPAIEYQALSVIPSDYYNGSQSGHGGDDVDNASRSSFNRHIIPTAPSYADSEISYTPPDWAKRYENTRIRNEARAARLGQLDSNPPTKEIGRIRPRSNASSNMNR